MTPSSMRVRIAVAAFILFGWIGVFAAAQVSPNAIARVAVDPEIQQPEIPLIQGPGLF